LRSVTWLVAAGALAGVLSLFGPGAETTVRAAGCGDAASDFNDLWTLTPLPGGDGVVRGPAPLTVTVTIRGGVVTFPGGLVVTTISWGDAGDVATIRSEPCGDGETEVWAQQDLSHTFTTPGQYFLGFSFSSPVYSAAFPFQPVEVTAAAATPAPAATTPAPVATTAAPAATTAAPAPASTTQPPALAGV